MIFLSPLISTFHHSPTAAIFFDFRWNSYYVQMGWSDPQRFASSSITHGTNVVHLFHVSLNVPSNLFFCCTVLLSYRTFARGVILCVLLVDYQLRENRRSVLFFSSYSIFVQFPFFLPPNHYRYVNYLTHDQMSLRSTLPSDRQIADRRFHQVSAKPLK
jgi:hypothetical protein